MLISSPSVYRYYSPWCYKLYNSLRNWVYSQWFVLPFWLLNEICQSFLQPSRQFRPPMSEVVDSLVSFSQKFNFAKTGVLADGTELDPFEGFFRSTNTRFIGSPVMSHASSAWCTAWFLFRHFSPVNIHVLIHLCRLTTWVCLSRLWEANS